MANRTVRCSECGRMNYLAGGTLVEAHCGRCESALTYYTWVAAGLRSRGLRRSLQVTGAALVLVAMFGADVVAWWDSDPFEVTATTVEETEARAALPEGSLALEAVAEN